MAYTIQQQLDMTTASTMRLQACADWVCDLWELDAIAEVWQLALQQGDGQHAPVILGTGSNSLLPVHTRCPIIRLRAAGLRLIDDNGDQVTIEVDAGHDWHTLVMQTVRNGWSGLENLVLIPGTTGAAPVQNIGAYGVEVGDRISGVRAWHTGRRQFEWLSAAACDFSYRNSRFKQQAGQWVITQVRFSLSKNLAPVLNYADLAEQCGPNPSASKIAQTVMQIRQAKLPDPAKLGNCGSYFHNPIVSGPQAETLKQQWPAMPVYPQADARYKLAAGWLIDQCGLKGYQHGRLGVYDRQALVLVNHASLAVLPEQQATRDELQGLEQVIQQAVLTRFGVALQREPVWVAE